MPKVSVIMAVYNGERYLEECLHSYAMQTYKDFEFLIMDDGSTDGSEKIIRKHMDDDCRIVIFHQQNAGLASALNFLISKANGTYIARMDVDDLVAPDRLEKQVRYLDEHPDVDLVTCGTAHFSQGRRLLFATCPKVRTKQSDDAILRGKANTLTHGSVMFRTSKIRQFQMPYRTKYGQDYDLWIRCLAMGWKFATVPEVLYFYRKGSLLQEDPVKNAIRDGQRNVAVRLRYEGRLFDDDYCLKLFTDIAGKAKSVSASYRPAFTMKRRAYALFSNLLYHIYPVWLRAWVYDRIFLRRGNGYLSYKQLQLIELP